MVLKRLGAVIGYAGQKNEVVYSTGLKHSIKELTCFFGGDVQNFPEDMDLHGKCMQWNVLATASLLATKFPLSSILLFLPSRFEKKTYSCYDNFVPSNKLGSPSHVPMANAIEHLKISIENSLKALDIHCIQDNDITAQGLNSTESDCSQLLDFVEDINLVGFSKGCVVLNQLIHEVHTISSRLPDSNLLNFWKKVKNIYWLDGAHSGGKETWVTDESVLKTLACCDLNIHIHVTPYQIEDKSRPWIRKECDAFVAGLKNEGSPVSYHVHFEKLPPCLENHFQVLDSFKQSVK